MMGAAKMLIYSNLSIQVGVALHLHLSALLVAYVVNEEIPNL